MNNRSIQTTILIYISVSAAFLVLALGIFVLFNHTKSLKNDLVYKMHIMGDDIVEHEHYLMPPETLKQYFMSDESYHKESYNNYIGEIKFIYTDSINDELPELSIYKQLPNDSYLVITSSSKDIDRQVRELLLRLGIVLVVILSSIILGLYLILNKFLYPLKCLVAYCNDSSKQNSVLKECKGSYEIDSLREAIAGLQKSNQALCKEKQNIFKEAAHEIKTPIAILKARLALYDKSDMPKDEFVQDCTSDISTISNKLRELIFLKAIEFDVQKAKESVGMQTQCSMMQQLFKPILEKKEITMISDLEEDFALYIHREAIGRVMQAVFENIFMHTKNGTTIKTYVDKDKHQLSIVNEIGLRSDEVLFSSHIGTKLIQRLAEKLEYEYSAHEKDGLFYTTIIFKGQNPLEMNL